MTEARLGTDLIRRFHRITWITLSAYIAVVLVGFTLTAETVLRRSLEQSADVIQSLLGMYADPEGARTSVAPAMLADQLLGMGEPFAITRTTTDAAGSTVYYLSPSMPAQRLEAISEAGTPEEMRARLLDALASRGRQRYATLYRDAGEFDIYVVASRLPFALGFVGLAAAAVLLLPVAALAARRGARGVVTAALVPLDRVAKETHAIRPDALSERIATPTGLHEVTALATAINRMLDRVETAHRTLESFTADASHELRTPLTHIRARVHWCLAESRTPDEMQEGFAAIEREVERTTKMIDDLLLIARGENRQLPVEREPFDVCTVVREVGEIAEAMAEGRDVVVHESTNGPVMVVGDANRTRQVLLNLAANAVRYTPEGTVSIGIRHDNGMVGVNVHDTGIGMTPEQIARIFDRFYRGDASRSRALGGSGLGLTIARVLAELQAGRIEVTSVPNEGSTFTLWLPAPS